MVVIDSKIRRGSTNLAFRRKRRDRLFSEAVPVSELLNRGHLLAPTRVTTTPSNVYVAASAGLTPRTQTSVRSPIVIEVIDGNELITLRAVLLSLGGNNGWTRHLFFSLLLYQYLLGCVPVLFGWPTAVTTAVAMASGLAFVSALTVTVIWRLSLYPLPVAVCPSLRAS